MMTLPTKHFDKSEELITELENLHRQKDTYIFRGHYDAKYILQPSAFREETRQKYDEAFPIKQEYISNEWLNSEKLSKKVKGAFSIENHVYNKFYPVCQLSSGFIYKKLDEIDRTIEWVIFIMKHNYSLTTNITDKDDWKSDDTFFGMLGNFFNSIKIIQCLDGTRWQDASPIEETTDLTEEEQLYKQHDGKATPVLDWTMNPYVAIYFAVDPSNESFNSQTGLFEAIKPPPKNLSIYALKRGSFKEIIDETNSRAKAQEALGIICEEPFTFYLKNSRLMSMEDCIEKKAPKPEIIKYTLPRSPENIDKLNSLLNTHNINTSSLFPD